MVKERSLIRYLKELLFVNKRIVIYVALSLTIILLSYVLYLILKEETVIKLGREDGLFEYLTSLAFLITSIFFMIIFFRRKKLIHLVFSLIFFIGMVEEISWGQRIIKFQSPEYFKENNIQSEFNIHNLKIFDSQEEGGNYKKGISYILSMNFLYKLFWFVYGIMLPIVYVFSRFVKKIIDSIDLLVPPFVLGLFFIINWTIWKIIGSLFVSEDASVFYYYAGVEINEFGSAIVFVMISAYFLQTFRAPVASVTRIQ